MSIRTDAEMPAVTLLRLAAEQTAENGLPQDLVANIRALFGSTSALLLEAPNDGQGWRAIGTADGSHEILTLDASLIEEAAKQSLTQIVYLLRGGVVGSGRALACLAVGHNGRAQCSVVMLLTDAPDLQRAITTAGPLVQLVASSAALQRGLGAAQGECAELAGLIDINERLVTARGFRAASQMLVDDLAQRLDAEEVALCWGKHGSARLKAMSHSDSIGRNTELSRLLEEAADEALIQQREIQWPPAPGDEAVAVAARAYATARGAGYIAIVPMGHAASFTGALVITPRERALAVRDLWFLRLLADQTFAPLAAQFGAHQNLARRVMREMVRGIGPFATGWQRRGILFALAATAIMVVLTTTLPHRVTAPFVLRTERTAQVGAPFDGYIESVSVRVGDPVSAGQVLFRMKTRELELERANVLADLSQHEHEAQKFQAAGSSADMRIALAQAEQSRIKLLQTDTHLAMASAVAPIDGIVVEGELPRQIGAPLRRSDPGFRVAGLREFYAEVSVPEADIAFVEPDMTGEIAFVGRPDTTFGIRVIRVVPQANLQSGENVLVVQVATPEQQPWWRPGMSGIAKLDIDRRPIWWLASRRMVDFLRMHLWW